MIDINQFYPTPPHLIHKMLEGIVFPEQTKILDPSAGKGDLLDAITGSSWKRHHKYAIEIDPGLQAVLISKDYTVLDSDFLEYKPTINFDFIIMNPPFRNGDDHFLKAWEILKNGTLICVLNAETLKNPFSKTRELIMKIIADNNGSIEFLQNQFVEAERQTQVEIALIKITKITPVSEFDFGEFENKPFNFEIDEERGIVKPDIITDIVASHDIAMHHLKEGIKHLNQVAKHVGGLSKYSDVEIKLSTDYYNAENAFSENAHKIKSVTWRRIIEDLDLRKYMSESVANAFQSKVEKQVNMAINENNIRLLVETLFMNRGNIFESAMQDVFDELTRYHEENRVYFEGWKTNKSYMINRKVILPYIVKPLDYRYGGDTDKFELGWSNKNSAHDLDKVLAHLNGSQFDNVLTITEALKRRFDYIGYIPRGEKFDNEVESSFFKIKFWRKGTCHIYFKDKALWDKFNYEVMKGKNWLPPGTKVQDGQIVEETALVTAKQHHLF